MTTIEKTLTIKVGRKHYAVASLQEASLKFEEARDVSGLGASKIRPALIYHGEKLVGYVSYNGRIWEGEPSAWSPATKMLFDNRAEA